MVWDVKQRAWRDKMVEALRGLRGRVGSLAGFQLLFVAEWGEDQDQLEVGGNVFMSVKLPDAAATTLVGLPGADIQIMGPMRVPVHVPGSAEIVLKKEPDLLLATVKTRSGGIFWHTFTDDIAPGDYWAQFILDGKIAATSDKTSIESPV